MSAPPRSRRGYTALALGVAAFSAAVGATYWYFTRDNSFESVWNRVKPGVKKKSVVIVLDQTILKQLPSNEESQSYADLYVICPPAIHGLYDETELLKKVQHPTRILRCSTNEGLIHIAKHISSDVVLLGYEYRPAVEKLKGWIRRIICLERNRSQPLEDGNVVFIDWTENKTLYDILNTGEKI